MSEEYNNGFNFTDMLDEEFEAEEELEFLKESKDLLDNVGGHVFNLYVHLLKYLNQKNRQSRSWISTINNSNDEIIKAYNSTLRNKRNDNYNINKRYYNVVNIKSLSNWYYLAVEEAARQTGCNIVNSPGVGEGYWDADFIRDRVAIFNLLIDEARDSYVEGLVHNVFKM